MSDTKCIRYNIDAFHRLIGQKLLKTCLTEHETEELKQFCEAADIHLACMNQRGRVQFTKRIYYGKRKHRCATFTFSEDGFLYCGSFGMSKEDPEYATKLLEHTYKAISVFLEYGLLEVR